MLHEQAPDRRSAGEVSRKRRESTRARSPSQALNVRYEDIVFLDVEDVDAAHENPIRLHGGEPSPLNPGLVASATMAPRSGYYTTLAELAAVYGHGIAKNHGYQDGKPTDCDDRDGHVPRRQRPRCRAWTRMGGHHGRGRRWHDLAAKITDLMGGDPVAIDE
jgi:hypothetical protein